MKTFPYGEGTFSVPGNPSVDSFVQIPGQGLLRVTSVDETTISVEPVSQAPGPNDSVLTATLVKSD